VRLCTVFAATIFWEKLLSECATINPKIVYARRVERH
jgi:hypothetical protein